MTRRPDLVFVSTRFLFPADSGGKIRTTQILRGLKGARFYIRLLMPAEESQQLKFSTEIESVCDELVTWHSNARSNLLTTIRKIASAMDSLPIPVATDQSPNGAAVVAAELARSPDVVVFDFPHSAVLAPVEIKCPTVMFTHNIEAEIFKRHIEVAATSLHRWLWRSQYRKMLRFEESVLNAFDMVIAVSERDREFFETAYSVPVSRAIPTGVDTGYFSFTPPQNTCHAVFCGSMDWLANIDGIEWFHEEVWPDVIQRVPGARMTVVGRKPPDSLVSRITSQSSEWTFTGYVDDVRPHISGADVFVVPLRVGGGTRIKAFEAMAMGAPVVSTSIGMEGLDVQDDKHYRNADSAEAFSAAVVEMLCNHDKGVRFATVARKYVEENVGFRRAARVFEEFCIEAIRRAEKI